MKGKQGDLILFITTLLLLAIGVTMVLSASAPYALNTFGDSYYFAKSQLIFAIIGIAIMIIVSNIDYRIYKRFGLLALIGGIGVLLLVFIPGLGVTRNNATRWINIGIQIQTSEITKIAVIVFFASLLSQKQYEQKLQKSYIFFWECLAVVGVIALILLKQPHMSAAVVILGISMAIIFTAGCNIKYILSLIPMAIAGIATLIAISPYRLARFQYWLDPWSDFKGEGWQLAQSLMAIGSGGLFGLGVGKSKQKYMYLPEQQNDFIFAVICEELGFLGAALVIILFAIFVWRGILISLKCKDKFGSLMAIGITTMIGLQAVFNIAVVTGTIPVTGISLPFFSYGGSSLLILLASTGVLLNISKNCSK